MVSHFIAAHGCGLWPGRHYWGLGALLETLDGVVCSHFDRSHLVPALWCLGSVILHILHAPPYHTACPTSGAMKQRDRKLVCAFLLRSLIDDCPSACLAIATTCYKILAGSLHKAFDIPGVGIKETCECERWQWQRRSQRPTVQ